MAVWTVLGDGCSGFKIRLMFFTSLTFYFDMAFSPEIWALLQSRKSKHKKPCKIARQAIHYMQMNPHRKGTAYDRNTSQVFPGNSRERIQDLLRERGISQAELAEKIGMSESSLSRYLSGQTDKLSTDNIVSIARVFEVTTDFLLCLTDIPFTTNYDIEKLGLSVKAAENMLKKKVDMGALNSLLVMPAFALLTQKLEQMRQGTFAAGLGSMKAVFTGAQDLLMEYAQNHPEDRRAAKQAIEEIRALQPVSAFELDTAEAEAIFRGIMQEFRASAKEYVEKAAKLTSTVMKRVLAKAHSQMKSPEKFRGFTPEMMVDSIIGSVPQLDLENEHVKVLHDALLPLFTRPQDLIKQRKENASDSKPSETKS